MMIKKKRVCLLLALTMSCVLLFAFKGQRYHYYIPVTFTKHLFPVIKASASDQIFEIVACTVGGEDVALTATALERVKNKIKTGQHAYKDGQGNLCYVDAYLIPELKVGNEVFKNVPVGTCQSANFRDGYIDIAMLKKNILLNFSENVIVVSNDERKLVHLGFDLKKMIKTTFRKKSLLDVEAETNLGYQRFMISTTISHNLINSCLSKNALCLEKFIIAGYNFGPVECLPHEIYANVQIDGALGMNFLERHPLYIDYNHQEIYLPK